MDTAPMQIQSFAQTIRQIDKLKLRFSEFAANAEGGCKQLGVNTSEFRDLQFQFDAARSHLVMTKPGLAGIEFLLGHSLGEDGAVQGVVKCFVREELPEKSVRDLGEFRFKLGGDLVAVTGTSPIDDQNNDPMTLIDDGDSVAILLYFFKRSVI